MLETVKGIVLRETPIGDYDKIMTVLTREHGKISVYATGAKRLKSPLFAAAQLFSYAEYTISKGKSSYYMRAGDLIESFYRVREDLVGIALATYIADIAADVAIEDEPEEALMRLVLNSFHAIAMRQKPYEQIKGVFELRAASIAGFLPDLVACTGCGSAEGETRYFDVASGNFRCEECFSASSALAEAFARRQNENEGIYAENRLILVLSPSVFAGMRYAIYSKVERMLSFELKDEALMEFASVAEKYILCHMDRRYDTLEFYHVAIERDAALRALVQKRAAELAKNKTE